MSDERRRNLVAKFRAGSIDRASRALELLAAPTAPQDVALRQLLGDLHTLKGEARMLGFASLSDLAHAIEGRVLEGRGSWPLAAIDACVAALETIVDHVGNDLSKGSVADAAFVAARDVLDSGALAVRPPEPPVEQTRAPEPTAPARAPVSPDAGYAFLRTASIDLLCERVDMLRANFGALGAARSSGSAAALSDAIERFRVDLDEITMRAWSLRLTPIEPILSPLANHARRLARRLGKSIRVVIDAARTEIERSILRELEEPLLHLVQNAVDHGIEAGERRDKPAEGLVAIRASSQSGTVVVAVEDDGRGIDPADLKRVARDAGILSAADAAAMNDDDALDLVFHHGLSTRASANDVSGRGVGLDVARTRVEALGGTIEVTSVRGRGTTFTIRVPSTVWRERVLVFEASGAMFGLPSRQVVHVTNVRETLSTAGGERLLFDGDAVPLASFSAIVGSDAESEEVAIVVDVVGRRQALRVGAVIGELDLVRRPADRLLGLFRMLHGSATLDNGQLVLLVHAADLAREATRKTGVRATKRKPAPPTRKLALVVDDSIVVRELVADLLRNVGLDVLVATNGSEALTCIDRRLPDIVLTDVEMPEMNGFELLERFRSKHMHVPVVMITTRGSAEDRRRAAELGADAYLVKTDFHSGELVQTVRRFLEVA